ncbi:MAG TPA: hypothetical protein VFE37_04300 [Chloroflexota bacterium]|nr:hypothetical protein [Chloroflexota bacterium]
MVAVAAIAVFLAALGALVVPLVRRSGAAADDTAPVAASGEPEPGLVDEREATLAALRELDFDFATGKLAEPDYHTLRAGYERRALALLKATDPEVAATVHLPPAHRNGVAAHAGRQNGVAAVAARQPGRGASGNRGRHVALAAGAVGVVFVAVTAAIYFQGSRSQGEQRAVATLDGVGPRALAVAPEEPERTYLAAATGLLVSGDAGSSWQPAAGLDQPLRALAVSPARPARVYAASPSALVVSDDGGRSWANQPVTLPERDAQAGRAVDVRALAVDPANADRLWLVAEGLGLYSSADGGATWTRTAADVPANATALAVVGESSAASPGGEAPLLYLASATDGVFASADGGRTWAPASGALNGALPTRRVSSLVFDANSGDTATSPDGRTLRGTLYAGTDQGVFRSVDRGQSWGRLSLGVPVAAVAAGGEAGAGLLLAVDREGAIYRSRNRGVTWDGS